MRPVKPRRPASLHDVVSQALGQVGLEVASRETIRTVGWLRDASDESRSPTRRACKADPRLDAQKAARLLYEDAQEMSRAGATAFAEDIAVLAGGAFLPVAISTDDAAIHAALAGYSKESGEAIAAIAQGFLDGKFDAADRRRALPEILDALRMLMALHALCIEPTDGPTA